MDSIDIVAFDIPAIDGFRLRRDLDTDGYATRPLLAPDVCSKVVALYDNGGAARAVLQTAGDGAANLTFNDGQKVGRAAVGVGADLGGSLTLVAADRGATFRLTLPL